MAANPPDANLRPTNVRWTVFALGCGASWLLYLHRYSFALIKPKLVEEWQLDTVQLGLLDTTFSVCYMAFQIPSGIAADALGAHLALGSMILLWSAALGLHAWAGDLATLRYARAALGLGQAGAYATLNRMTRTWFPLAVRTSVQGWMGVFFGRIGGASANLIMATLLIGVLYLDWRTAVYVLSAAGIALGIAFLLLFRNSPRNHPLVNRAEADLIEGVETPDATASSAPDSRSAPPRLSVRQLFRRMSLRSILNLLALNLQTTLSTIADNIYSNWIPLFLYEIHDLKFAEMGVYSALPLIGGACGGVAGGLLNDRLIQRSGNRRWSRSAVGVLGKGLAGVLLLSALLWYGDPYVFCGLLFFVKFFSDCSLASTWGTVSDIGGRTTATVYAFNNSVATIGSILAPILFGFVAKHYGWTWVFVIVAATYGLCSASWLAINCTVPVVAEE
jgi:ACS family D-galactonate transporter-like MFS transporter